MPRPMGVVGGSVKKAEQSAAEIVQETLAALNGAQSFIRQTSKL